MVAVGTTCAVSVCLSLIPTPSGFRSALSILKHPTDANVQTVAGIFALLNDFLVSRNQLPLGFLNPLLYGDGLEGLTDIISGSNPGCGTDGFPATVGWDPVRTARLHFRRWLNLCFIGHGSRDAKLSSAAEHPSTDTLWPSGSASGATLTTCMRSFQSFK